MKKYLLPKEGTFYKANLHCHTTLSDGRLTPAEIKELYKSRGYSIVAYSDHDALFCNYHLTDDDFVALTAYETSIRNDKDATPHAHRTIIDFCLYAKEPENNVMVGFHPDAVRWLVNKGVMTEDEMKNIPYAGDMECMHTYYPGDINKIIKSANENGYLVSMNHPAWALMNYNDYSVLDGLWAMEIYNHGCRALTGMHDSQNVYDDMLRCGKKIFCLATDDNHNTYPVDSYRSDSFGGFTMIKCDSLDYATVISAMEKGSFYASTGPEIYELYYEDGYVYIACSPAKEICLTTLGRRGERIASDDGSTITKARFAIDKELYKMIRIVVVDEKGEKAYTNGYFVEDFME